MIPTVLLDNRYKVLHSLASGGFGATYLAADTRVPSQRQCVVKQLKAITQDPALYAFVQERFTREAVVLEELGHHAQIPQLYAYFEEDGQFYLVQEYIPGKTLAQQLEEQGAWTEDHVQQLVRQLLPVLAFIHQRGIIHRDIKPENILLPAGNLPPVLIDFGAVKEALNTQVAVIGHAEPSVVIGTTGFMPPEQAVGHPVLSSDLYALSLTAICCLTGQRPQTLDSDLKTGELLWQHKLPDISPAFAEILTKAIRPIPTARFSTATAMLEALAPSPVNPLNHPPEPVIATTHFPGTTSSSSTAKPTAVISPGKRTSAQPPLDLAPYTEGPRQPTLVQPAEQPSASKTSPFPGLKWLLLGVGLAIVTATSGILLFLLPPRSQPSVRNDNPPEQDSIPIPEVETETTGGFVKGAGTTTGPGTNTLSITAAKTTVEQYYKHLSNHAFNEAKALMGDELAAQFDPDYFDQFQRVSVENLRMSSQTPETVEIIGQNSYFYHDGSIQQEERSFTIQYVDKTPRIIASEFIQVTQPRN